MTNVVREPIQVYLTREERSELDRAAQAMGVSRSEALRRGIRAVSAGDSGPLEPLRSEGLIESARALRRAVPPSIPVAPLDDLLAELERDRGAR